MTKATVATPALDGPNTGLLAVPFSPTPPKMQKILEAVVAHPWWFNAPATDEQRAFAAAALVNDPFNKVWEVWRGGVFVGILILWRIQPQVDAVLHFVFFDQNLVGKRSLLLSFLGHCYHDLGFRRISMEVPEFKMALAAFARRKLGFIFEGEGEVQKRVEQHKLRVKDPYRSGHKESLHVIIAAAGSRREAAHWHEGTWHDVLCLRQTAAEYDRFTEGRD